MPLDATTLYEMTQPILIRYTRAYNGILDEAEIEGFYNQAFTLSFKNEAEFATVNEFGADLRDKFSNLLRNECDRLFRQHGLHQFTADARPGPEKRRAGLSALRQIRFEESLTIGDGVDDSILPAPSAEEEYFDGEATRKVRSLLSVIPARDRMVLAWAYGMEPFEDDVDVRHFNKQEFVGFLGLSVESVRNLDRMVQKATMKFATALTELGFDASDFGYLLGGDQ